MIFELAHLAKVSSQCGKLVNIISDIDVVLLMYLLEEDSWVRVQPEMVGERVRFSS